MRSVGKLTHGVQISPPPPIPSRSKKTASASHFLLLRRRHRHDEKLLERGRHRQRIFWGSMCFNAGSRWGFGEWKEKFRAFDRSPARFRHIEKIPVKGFSIKNSEVLSWAFCDSSKLGRNLVPINSECWMLHSTAEYACSVITRTGLQKPSNNTLAKVAEELFQEFVTSGLNIPRPFFMKAHRWGSVYPTVAIGGEDKCVWDEKKRLAICGDFCVSPNAEGAVLSGMGAASKFI